MSDSTKRRDTPHSDTARNLSTTIPNYLVNLAHEPSVGLHYLATHAQTRVAPSLSQVTGQLKHRTTTVSNLSLDVNDATTVITEDMPAAQKTISRISYNIEAALASLRQDPLPPPTI